MKFLSQNIRKFSSNTEHYLKCLACPVKKLIVVTGPAGTGKTMMACEEAVKQLKTNTIKKIVVTRPLVGADNDIGYLPGTLEDKMAPWTRPILDVFYEHFTKQRVLQLIKNDIIEISPFIYMRGRTFKNSFIIGDELQNANTNQMKMLLTRIGENSKMVVNGDLEQKDMISKSGLEDFINILNKNEIDESIALIKMDNTDVKRSEIVNKIIKFYNCVQ